MAEQSVPLSKKETMLLQKIVNSDAIEIMGRVASTMLINWSKVENANQSTAFLTAKVAIGREERKKALTLFLEQLERLAHG